MATSLKKYTEAMNYCLGNLILVKHENGWTTAYAHLDKFFVNLGAKLKTGDILVQ